MGTSNNRVERTGNGAEATERKSLSGGSQGSGPLVDLSNPSSNRDFASATSRDSTVPAEFGNATLSFAPGGEQGSFQNNWQQKFLGTSQDAGSTAMDVIANTGSIPSTADISRIDAARSEIGGLSDVSAEVRGQALADLNMSHDRIKHRYTDKQNQQIADVQNNLAAGNFQGFTAALQAAGQNPSDGVRGNEVLNAAQQNIEMGLAGATPGLHPYERVNLQQDGDNVLAYRDNSGYALQVNPDGTSSVRALSRDEQGNVSVDEREVPASEMTPEAVFNNLSNFTASQVGDAFRNMMDYLNNPTSPPSKDVPQAPIQREVPKQQDQPPQRAPQIYDYPSKADAIPPQGPTPSAGQNNPNPVGPRPGSAQDVVPKGRTPEARPPVLNHTADSSIEDTQDNPSETFDY